MDFRPEGLETRMEPLVAAHSCLRLLGERSQRLARSRWSRFSSQAWVPSIAAARRNDRVKSDQRQPSPLLSV